MAEADASSPGTPHAQKKGASVVAGLWIYLEHTDKLAGGLDRSQQVVFSDTKSGMTYLNDGRSIVLEDLQNGTVV